MRPYQYSFGEKSLYVHHRKRIVGLDMAKGFTVLFIPSIHAVMVYSNSTVHQSWLGFILGFIAEWPGAQLLMLAMGMSFSLSRKAYRYHFIRALAIFGLGYVLNFCKFWIPYFFDLLPEALLNDLHFAHSFPKGLQLILIGNILQFAVLSLLLMTLLKQSIHYLAFTIIIAYMVIICSPLLWDFHHSNGFIDHLLHLAGGAPDDVFFPLFPWLAYPLIGMATGYYLQLPFAEIKPLFVTGCIAFLGAILIRFLLYHFPDTTFWRTYPDITTMHLGFVMMWITSWLWLGMKKEKLVISSKLFLVLQFCGRHITLIYVTQWLIIFWLLPLIGYHSLNIAQSILAISLVNILVFCLIVYIVKK